MRQGGIGDLSQLLPYSMGVWDSTERLISIHQSRYWTPFSLSLDLQSCHLVHRERRTLWCGRYIRSLDNAICCGAWQLGHEQYYSVWFTEREKVVSNRKLRVAEAGGRVDPNSWGYSATPVQVLNELECRSGSCHIGLTR